MSVERGLKIPATTGQWYSEADLEVLVTHYQEDENVIAQVRTLALGMSSGPDKTALCNIVGC